MLDDVNENVAEPIDEKIKTHYLACKCCQKLQTARVSTVSECEVTPFSGSGTQQRLATPRMADIQTFSAAISRIKPKACEEYLMDDNYDSDSSQEGAADSSESGGILVLEVIDTGIGMTEEEVSKLFNPFTQANAAIKGKFGGTGLGLWITKQLIERMNGVIEVRSQHKKGTRFRVLLPFDAVKQADVPMPSFPSIDENLVHGTAINLRAAKLGAILTPPNCNNISIPSSSSRLKSRATTGLKSAGHIKFKGMNEKIKGMSILLLECERTTDDILVEQIMSQLKETDCSLYYGFYSSAVKLLQEYRFDVVVIVSTYPHGITRELVSAIMKLEKELNEIPLSIASGNSVFPILFFILTRIIALATKREFGETTKNLHIVLPLKEGDILSMLFKVKNKALYFLKILCMTIKYDKESNVIWRFDRLYRQACLARTIQHYTG